MHGKLALVGAKQPTVQSHTQKKRKRKSKRLVEQEYEHYRLFHVYWYHGAITGLGFLMVLGVFYSVI